MKWKKILTAVALVFMVTACAAPEGINGDMGGDAATGAPAPVTKSIDIYDVIEDGVAYKVYYGTTRQLNKEGLNQENGPYSVLRDSGINYGSVKVFIPDDRNRGSLGSRLGELLGSNRLIKIMQYNRFNTVTQFENAVKADLLLDGPKDDYVVVFIHGYNNSFNEAAIRAAQFGYDVGVPKNHMFLFSWPAKFSTATYTNDEATVDVTDVYLAGFLAEVAKVAPNKKIHIVAHSMGNRALLRAINREILSVSTKQKIKFGQIILAAADVDVDLFAQLAPAYVAASTRTTVFLSPYDNAVGLSEFIHQYPRVGCGIKPHKPVPGLDYIVSTVPEDFPAHAYIAENVHILNYISSLFESNIPLHTGGEWREVRKDNYWLVGPKLIADKEKCDKKGL